ncbi:MAG: hypothetical protein K2L98_02485, partial [Bacilli bacterium]|nr:hypothetical protein [Bacilli bacterium]
MKKRDSWDSEFRKRKFYKNQELKALKKYLMGGNPYDPIRILKSTPLIIPKSIAIMLDLDGTSNRIDSTTAELFMKQVDTLRIQFGGEKAYICISTHAHGYEKIKYVMDELNAFAKEGIVLSRSFYYGGMYDYVTDSSFPMGIPFNMNKVETFQKTYIDNEDLNVGWFALIDDGIAENVFKSYQFEKAMVALRPGRVSPPKYNNFMYRSTSTDNFDGVVELMDEYIKDVKDMTRFDIIDKQIDMVTHLSSFEIHELIRERKFNRLIRYLKSDKTDEDDFECTYSYLIMES